MTVFNPFIVGTYVSEQYFCDRKEEKRILIDHIRNGRNAVLFSERRMGRTGLIQHVFHDQKIQEDFHCLYFDAFACGNIQEFTFALSNCIFRSLKKSVAIWKNCRQYLIEWDLSEGSLIPF